MFTFRQKRWHSQIFAVWRWPRSVFVLLILTAPVWYILSAAPVWYTLWRLPRADPIFGQISDVVHTMYKPAEWLQESPMISELYQFQHEQMVKIFGDVPHAFVLHIAPPSSWRLIEPDVESEESADP